MSNANITIISEGSDTSLKAFCDYAKNDGEEFVEYDEFAESGFGKSKTRIIFSEKELTIKRSGEVEMEMIFRKGDVTTFPLETDYGGFFGVINTVDYTFCELGKNVDINVNYELSFAEGTNEKHNIRILIDKGGL